MSQLLLTVITPVFQGRRFIESCLQSVIEQKCDCLEHLIIDGGSTDGTIAIVEDYARRYPHIRWISEKDSGQSNAMNKGARLAKGQFISFLNTDDYYEPGALNTVVPILRKLKEPAFLAGNCRIWNDKKEVTSINRPKKLDVGSIILTWEFPVNPSAYFYHKSLHEKVGYYNEEDHDSMDLEFILRALPAANVKYVNQILGNYRLLEDTKTFRSMQEGRINGIIRKHFRVHYERLPWFPKLYVKAVGKIGWIISQGKYYLKRILYYLSHPAEMGKFFEIGKKG